MTLPPVLEPRIERPLERRVKRDLAPAPHGLERPERSREVLPRQGVLLANVKESNAVLFAVVADAQRV
jgi:hypothetical protein